MTSARRPRGGRPRTLVPTVPTSVHIPLPIYDAICRRALRRGCSVHRLLLEVIRRAAATEAGGFPSHKTPSRT